VVGIEPDSCPAWSSAGCLFEWHLRALNRCDKSVLERHTVAQDKKARQCQSAAWVALVEHCLISPGEAPGGQTALDAFDCLDTPGADGLGERTVIMVVLVGITFREVGD
jgi:hypothetical protein